MAGDAPDRRSAGAAILVVDDEPGVRHLIRAILKLRPQPVSVLEAEDGLQALSIARRVRPDLVLLDIRLPEMDGLSVLRHLKDDPATVGIPVVLVTALSDDAEGGAVRAVGADGYLRKPFRAAELLAVVDRLLARRLAA